MRWFWGFLVAIAAAYGVGLCFGFFNDFSPQEWATLLGATAALLVSIFTLARTRRPRQKWSIAYFEGGSSPARGIAPARRSRTMWIVNDGPGDAERVWLELKKPGGQWERVGKDPEIAQVVRGGRVHAQLYAVQGTAASVPKGKYSVRVHFRALPDTTKEQVSKPLSDEVGR